MKTQPIEAEEKRACGLETRGEETALPSSAAAIKYFGVIARQPYFKGLSARQLKSLANAAVETRLEANKSIFDEGDNANRFYIITEGKVLIEAETEERGRVAIQTLEPCDDLGWSWLFPPYHTQFSARTLTPVTMLLFYAPTLRHQCETDHDFGYELTKRVAGVMLERLQAMRRRLFEETAKREKAAKG